MSSDKRRYTVLVQFARSLGTIPSLRSLGKKQPQPYVQIRSGSLVLRTTTALQSVAPAWNQSLSVAVTSEEPIIIEVFHEGHHGPRSLGRLVLTEIETASNREFALETAERGPAGWLTLSIMRDPVISMPGLATESQPIQLAGSSTVARDSPAPLPTGIYRIVNNPTKDCAALLDGNEDSSVYTITRGEHDPKEVGDMWEIKYLKPNTYTIKNVRFASFASFHPFPTAGEWVLGKPNSKKWVIKFIERSNAYAISPSGKFDIFWTASNQDGAQIVFGPLESDQHAHWTFLPCDPRTPIKPGRRDYVMNASMALPASMYFDDLKTSQILDQLKPVDMDTSSRPRCRPKTRLDHIQTITQWVASMSRDNVLWISGVAGAGKSTLVTTISDTFRTSQRLGAFIYFNRNEAAYSQPAHVVKTIAHQLAKFDLRLGTAISAIISGDSQVLNGSLVAQFTTLIAGPVGSIVLSPEEGPIVLIVDGLDECGTPANRRDILRILSDKFALLPNSFRTIITSRMEPDIEAAILHAKRIRRHHIDTEAPKSKADVAQFIRDRMEEIEKLVRPGWPGEERIIKLATKATGLFVWAATSCAFLEEYPTDQRLDRILGLQTPSPLAPLYQLYATAVAAAGNWSQPDFAKDCHDVLALILAASAPLSCATIDTLRGSNSSVAITLRFKSLLHWSETDPIRPIHASFSDYLTDSASCGDKPWFIDLPSEIRILAHRCIDLLDRELRENIVGLDLTPDWTPEESERPSSAVCYAAVHWISRITMGSYVKATRTSISEKVLAFLQVHLLHWIEVMCILDKSRSCANMLQQLHDWSTHDELSRFVTEAARFCRLYANEIQEHPLVVYNGSLPLAPTESLVYKTFHRPRLPHVLHISGTEPQWARLQTLHSGAEAVHSIAFSQGGALLATSGEGSVQVWSVAYGTPCYMHNRDLPDRHGAVAFVNGDTHLVSGDEYGGLHIWEIASGDHLRVVDGHSGEVVQVVAYPPEGTDLFASIGGDQLRFGRTDGSSVCLLGEQSQDVLRCAFSSDGCKLATIYPDGMIRLWNVPKGDPDGCLTHSADEQGSDNAGIHFTHSDENILSHWGDQVCIWNVERRERIQSIDGRYRITAISSTEHFFHDANTAISVRHFDGQTRHELRGYSHTICSLATHLRQAQTDGGTLACGFEDGTIRLWDINEATRQPVHVHRPNEVVWLAAISLDGTLIATLSARGSKDRGTIQFWKIEDLSSTHSTIQIQLPSNSSQEDMRFSEDGRMIAYRYRVNDGEDDDHYQGVNMEGDKVGERNVVQAWGVRSGNVELLPPPHAFDWDSDRLDGWADDGSGWFSRNGKYVTKLPKFASLLAGRGTIALLQETGTNRFYGLHLPQWSASGGL